MVEFSWEAIWSWTFVCWEIFDYCFNFFAGYGSVQIFYFFLFQFFFFYVYLFLRDREGQSTSGGGAEKEWDTESEAGSRLWAISTEPDTGLKLTNCEIMTWAEVGHNRLSHPGAQKKFYILIESYLSILLIYLSIPIIYLSTLIYLYYFGVISKKPLPKPRSWLTSIFSSMNLIVLAFTFWTLIYFYFIIFFFFK